LNRQPQLVDHPTPEPDYTRAITLRLIRELSERGPLTFQDLVRAAEGAYPSDVLFTLHSLEKDGQISRLTFDRWSKGDAVSNDNAQAPSAPISSSLGQIDGLPEPHPVDFDWRFTDATLSDLEGYIHASSAARVAVLGAPTLFQRLSRSGVSVHLFDKNPQIVEHFRAVGNSSVSHCDLFKFSGFPSRFQWAIADPPWYLEHYCAFIAASSKILEVEGKLLLSVLPRLTRPSAPRDRLNIVEMAAKVGFDLIEVRPGALHYESPPFEVEALNAEKLALDDWRSGDIFCFSLRSRPLTQTDTQKPAEDDTWLAFQLGTTIVKIKDEQRQESEQFDYGPVSPSGSIRLRSVSRRSPVRSKINLWSSRNVALTVSKPVALVESLEKLRTGHSLKLTLATTAYEYQLSSREVDKLREVLELLSKDAGVAWSE
jgi:hypothetical protein